MGKSCCVDGCLNKYPQDPGIHFFLFPFKRPDILQKWVLAINKKNFKPDNNHHVCSAHFKDEDFQQHLGCFRKVLKEHAVPSVFPAYQKYYQYKSNKLRNTRTSAAAQSQHPETLPSTSSCEPVMVTSDVLIFKNGHGGTARNSARLLGPEYFHNFKGYYFYSTNINDSERCLRCLAPTCMAEARMTLEDNAEIRPVPHSCPHNHPPDLATKYEDKLQQMESLWANCVASERLPSLRQDLCCYYDNKGFYYHQTNQIDNIRYLACIEPTCSTKAHMFTQHNSPITVSPLRPPHNHITDVHLRDALLFVDAVKARVKAGFSPYDAAQLERKRNPVGASRVDQKALDSCLHQSLEVNFSACLKSADSFPEFASETAYIPVSNHFDTPVPILELPGGDRRLVPSGDRKEYEKLDPPLKSGRSEEVPDLWAYSWLYHDFQGHYYKMLGVSQDKRILECAVLQCPARGWMTLEPQAAITAIGTHNHAPKPPQHRTELWFYHRVVTKLLSNWDNSITQVYGQVAAVDPKGAELISKNNVLAIFGELFPNRKCRDSISVQTPSAVPAEELLGNPPQYHGGDGFYYYKVRTAPIDIWYLRCVRLTSCPGKATLQSTAVPAITLEFNHNHRPDLHHRQLFFFIHTLKSRIRDEVNTPLRIIYNEEAIKYPDAAAALPEEKVNMEMLKIRRYIEYQMDLVAEGDGADSDSVIYHEQVESAASEAIQGRIATVFYDGRGYYFTESFSTDTFRYLMCVEPQCVAQAKILLVSGAPVVAQKGSASHNHSPDPLRGRLYKLLHTLRETALYQRGKPLRKIYDEALKIEPIIIQQIAREMLIQVLDRARHAPTSDDVSTTKQDNAVEEEDLFLWDVPAERLPSHKHQGWLYHDGRGFYYTYSQLDSDTRLDLHCCDCPARAWLGQSPDAAITRAAGSVLHNHKPDMQRRHQLLLIHRVVTRASIEATPLSVILKEVSKRYPEAITFMEESEVKDLLDQITVSKFFKGEMEFGDKITSENISNGADYYKEFSSLPYEILHSIASGQPIYNDGRGFYFREKYNTSNEQHLICIWPQCNARAVIVHSSNRIRAPTTHNHRPDTFYANKLKFVDILRRRVLNEHTPVNTIYNQEANREPIGADLLNEVAIKNFMFRLLKSKTVNDETDHVDLRIFCDLEDWESISNKAHEIPELESKAENIIFKTTTNNSCSNNTEDNDNSVEVEEENSTTETPLVANRVEVIHRGMMAEKVTSLINTTLWHVAGFFYLPLTKITGNGHSATLKCRCIDKGCYARCRIITKPGKTPSIKDVFSQHNHLPDPNRKLQLSFIRHCKMRVVNSTDTIHSIYNEEAAMFPLVANQLSANRVKREMLVARKKNWDKSSRDSVNDDSSKENCDDYKNIDNKITKFKKKMEDESQPAKPNQHFESNQLGATILYNGSKYFNGSNMKSKLENKRPDETRKRNNVSINSVEEEDNSLQEISEAEDGSVPEFTDVVNLEEEFEDYKDDKLLQSEILPGFCTNYTIYHDGRGYYYVRKRYKETVWYLICIEPLCRARARMKPVVGSPIVLTKKSLHNHQPDMMRRQKFLWMEAAKRRAIEEDLPITTIYAEEALRDPESAKLITPKNMKKRLAHARAMYRKSPTQAADSYNQTRVCQPALNRQLEYFCDDKGFFYKQTSVRLNIRYMNCVEAGCKVRATMDVAQKNRLGIILLTKYTPSHNHEPGQYDLLSVVDNNNGDLDADNLAEEDLDIAGQDYEHTVLTKCHSEEQQNYPLRPGELIPGMRVEANNYHDGNGYYYKLNRASKTIRYLKCVNKTCRARAYMEIGKADAPIIQTNIAKHNHEPDLSRKQLSVFLRRVTERAAKEDTPVDTIYQEEVYRDPEAAGKIKEKNVKQQMFRQRRKQKQLATLNNITNFAGSDADKDGAIFRHLMDETRCEIDGISDTYLTQESVDEDNSLDLITFYESFVDNEVEVESSLIEN